MSVFSISGYVPEFLDILLHVIPGLVIYQILGAIRHVGAHAFMYYLGGYQVTELKLLPHVYHNQFYWAYYRTRGIGGARYSAVMELAPYVACLMALMVWTFTVLTFRDAWSTSLRLTWHLKLAFSMMFMVSPILDLALNVTKFLLRQGDFYRAYVRWSAYK